MELIDIKYPNQFCLIISHELAQSWVIPLPMRTFYDNGPDARIEARVNTCMKIPGTPLSELEGYNGTDRAQGPV